MTTRTNEEDRQRRPLADVAMILTPALWAGMLLGVSFLSTPARFSAPSLELGPALDVGRITFGIFSRVEWGFAAALMLAVAAAGLPRWRSVAAVLLVTVVAIQAVWLLPVLDARAATVIAGDSLSPSSHHGIYSGLEVGKLALLLVLSICGAWMIVRGPSGSPSEAAGGD